MKNSTHVDETLFLTHAKATKDKPTLIASYSVAKGDLSVKFRSCPAFRSLWTGNYNSPVLAGVHF